jgi:two-component system sensor histidine kinase HydH
VAPACSEDVRKALFRPFFSTKSGGLGIGLALVKRMVEQWGGQIALQPAPVKGTCVELRLPLATLFPEAQE